MNATTCRLHSHRIPFFFSSSPAPSSSRTPKKPYFFPPWNYTASLSSKSLFPLASAQIPPGSGSLVDEAEAEFISPATSEFEATASRGVKIVVEKTGKNRRRIYARIGVDASLGKIWGLLTDYERLPEFIPGLAVCQLMEKRENFARLYQIGQQNLALGLKFNAKGVVDCYEKDLMDLPSGQRRDIEFKMTEGDFHTFEGKWSIVQGDVEIFHEVNLGPMEGLEFESILYYMVDVEPKMWLPIRLVEGRLCKEIDVNLTCIRDEAYRVMHEPLGSLK